MACPYFSPQQRLEDKGRHPRLPLGDLYDGVCRADPLREIRPDESTARELCNVGYARHKCARFPAEPGPDAVRFSAVSDEAGVLKIFYIRERDRAPFEHGTFEYVPGNGGLRNGPADELLRDQARAYAASYLRRKQDPDQLARNPSRR